MAAILQLRRGTNSQTGSNFAESELFYNQSKETLQIGYASMLDGNLITLTRLNLVNTGSLSLTGDITASNAYFRGDVRLDGQIFLGDVPTDNINVNAQFSGSLIPSQSNAFDLGSVSNPWRTIYSTTINGAISDTHILSFTASQETKDSTLATYTGSIDTKNSTLGIYTASIDTKFTTLATYSGSVNNSLGLLNGFTASEETKNNTLGATTASLMSFTSSQETKNNTLGDYTASIDTKNNTLGDCTASLETKNSNLADWSGSIDTKNDTLGSWSGSTDSRLNNIESFTSSQETRNNTLGDYTASIDTKFNTLGDYTTSIDLDISAIHSYTSSLRTAIAVDNQDLLVYGNLTVQGTQTSLNTTEVYVEDKTLTLASGSNNSAEADGAGIIIAGAGKSILWNNTNQSFDVNTKVSSSVGFKGDGSELTGVHAADVEFSNVLNKPTLISGSDQVTSSLDLRYLEINGDSVVSGSSQIDLTQTANYISGIKDRLNAETVVSGSSQITNGSGILSSSVDTYDGFSSSVDSRLDTAELFSSSIDAIIKTKINVETVVSGSDQVTASLDLRYENIASGTHTLVSGSSQLTSSLNTLYEVSGSVSSLVGIRANSGSLGSAAWYHVSNSIADGNPNILGNGYAVKTYIDQAMTLAGAGDITDVNAGKGLSGGALSGSATLTLDTGSTHFIDAVKTKLNLDGVLSGSIDGTYVTDVQFEAYTTSVDSSVSHLNTFTASINTSYEAIASGTHTLISGSSQLDGKFINNLSGSFTGSFKGNINGYAAYSDATKILNSSTNQDYSILFTTSGSNGYLTQYTDGLSNLLYNPSTNRLKADYIHGAIEATNGVISGSSQIVAILDPLNTFSASQETKNSTLATYTGSVDTKFTTLGTYTGSVDNSLSGLNAVSHSHSNKANLDSIDQNLSTTSDVQFNDVRTAGSASIGTNLTIYGNLQVFGTQSIINSQNLSVNDNLIYLAPTASGDWDLGIVGHYNDGVYQHTGIFTDASDGHAWKVFKGLTAEVSGTVDTSHPSFALADFKAANITATSFNGTINSTNGLVSGSSQIDATATTNWSTGIKTQLNSNTVVSGSSQIVAGSTTGFATDVKTQLNSNTVVSGSSQIDLTTTTNYVSGIKTRLNAEGVVSGSTQITKTLQNVTDAGSTTSNAITITNATDSTDKTTGALIVTGGIGVSGAINAGGDVVAYASSDRRLKNNIQPIENPIHKINQISGYTFDWDTEKQHIYTGKDYGVIAQEIEEVFPELVQTRENGFKAVKYDKLVSVLIEGIKQLSKDVEDLKTQLNRKP